MAAKTTTQNEQVVVVDLAAVEVRSHSGALTATLTSTGELLADVPTTGPAPTPMERVRLFDEVLATCRLWRDGGWRRVVLYHPVTARMSLGALPATEVLWAAGPLELDAAGTLGLLRRRRSVPVIEVAGSTATLEEPSVERLYELAEAQQVTPGAQRI